MRSIMDAAERAAFLTQQMLAYAGRGRFVIRTIELGKLVQEIVPMVRTSIPKGVEIILDLDAKIPPVEADLAQLQQVVMNLIINGAEAVPEGESGRVDVRTRVQDVLTEENFGLLGHEQLASGRYVCLEVKDTGIGMDEDTRARMFDPFFTTKFTGRGLGLAAVQGIIRTHHGGIRVHTIPGAGTSFQVLLPVSHKPQAATQEAKSPKFSRVSGTVLVIGDEQMIRSLAKSILERQGFKVVRPITVWRAWRY